MSKVKALIESRMQQAGIQTQYRKYDKPPDGTYSTWYIDREKLTGSDGQTRIRRSDIVLELCTIDKDFDAEEKVETAFEDCEITKQEDYNTNENLYTVTCNFTITTKIKRRMRT